MINNITLIGRLTMDVEVRETPSGKLVGSSVLAVDRNYKGKDGEKQTDFIRFTVWGERARYMSEWTKKGKLVAIDGELNIDNYIDKDGNKRTSANVNVRNFQVLESLGQSQERQPQATQQTPPEFGEVEPYLSDDGLPF